MPARWFPMERSACSHLSEFLSATHIQVFPARWFPIKTGACSYLTGTGTCCTEYTRGGGGGGDLFIFLEIFLHVDDVFMLHPHQDVYFLEDVFACVFIIAGLPPDLREGHNLDGELLSGGLVRTQLHNRKPCKNSHYSALEPIVIALQFSPSFPFFSSLFSPDPWFTIHYLRTNLDPQTCQNSQDSAMKPKIIALQISPSFPILTHRPAKISKTQHWSPILLPCYFSLPSHFVFPFFFLCLINHPLLEN
jgi:hypothetical protein